MEILVYCFILLMIALLFSHIWPRKKCGKTIPGPKGLPLVGNMFEFSMLTMHNKFYDYAKTFGDIMRIKILGINIISLNIVETVQTAFAGHDYKVYTNDRPYTFLGEYVLYGNKGIVFCNDGNSATHSELRKLFTKGLHVYGDGIHVFEKKIMNEIVNMNSRIRDTGGTEIDMMSVLKRSLSNVLSVFLSGEPIKDSLGEDVNIFWEYNDAGDFIFSPMANAVYSIAPFMRFVPGKYRKSFQRMMHARQKIHEHYFFRIKETHVRGNIRGFVDFLLDEQTNQYESDTDISLTDETIKAMIQDLVPAGIISTLSTLSNLFICLLNHPEYQLKTQEELNHAVGNERLPNLSDRQNCPFIEALVMETLRYIPLTPLGVPHVTKRNLQFEGFDLPARSNVIANMWYIHHDERIWGDPWTFRPERFLDDNGHLLPRGHLLRKSLIPFGVGRRQCIGETFARSRMFLYASSLLQKWTFIPSPGKVGSCDPRKGDFEIKSVIKPVSLFCKVNATHSNL